jgi:uncharacterized membrane protein
MRDDHRFRKEKGLTQEQKHMIPMIGLAVLAVLLIIIIVIVDHKGKVKDVPAEQATIEESAMESAESPEESITENEEDLLNRPEPGEEPEEEETAEEETESGNTASYATENFRQDSDPEILSMMQRYFEARSVADAETINELYGITDMSEADLESERMLLLKNAKYISSVSDITTYVMDGTDENNWLVYTTAQIKFYTARVKAPMVMWCYMQKGEDGNYVMLDSRQLTSAMQERVTEANHSDEVRRLAADINAQLRQLLTEDEGLAEAYGVLYSGSQVWEGTQETEAEVVVLGEGAENQQDEADEADAEAESTEQPESTASAQESSTEAAESQAQ